MTSKLWTSLAIMRFAVILDINISKTGHLAPKQPSWTNIAANRKSLNQILKSNFFSFIH